MSGVGVGNICVDALITGSRRRNHALMFNGWRGFGRVVIRARRILALGRSLFGLGRIMRSALREVARSESAASKTVRMRSCNMAFLPDGSLFEREPGGRAHRSPSTLCLP
jgi:hypothetical protein